jgi:hypothetical protein
MAPPLMSYECSEYVYPHLNIHNSSTRSHALEDENRARNHSKSCKCKRALREYDLLLLVRINL